MSKTIRDFKYRLYASGKGQLPHPAMVRIGLRTWSTDEAGWIFISPDLMTEDEIDYEINAHKDDLDRVGKLAKRALKRANDRTLRPN